MTQAQIEKCWTLLVLMTVWCTAATALAGGVGGFGGGGGLPWDSPVASLRGSVKSTVAPALVLIGIVITIWDVVSSGEMSQFGRRGPAVMVGGAGVLGAESLVSMFSSGGLLP